MNDKMIQKLMGVAAVVIGILSVPFLEMDGSGAIVLVPLGLYLIFSRNIVIYR